MYEDSDLVNCLCGNSIVFVAYIVISTTRVFANVGEVSVKKIRPCCILVLLIGLAVVLFFYLRHCSVRRRCGVTSAFSLA
jgi:hypothetical protein